MAIDTAEERHWMQGRKMIPITVVHHLLDEIDRLNSNRAQPTPERLFVYATEAERMAHEGVEPAHPCPTNAARGGGRKGVRR